MSEPTERLVSFRPLTDPAGIEIRDEVEGLTYTFRTDATPEPELADAATFPFPIDEAVSFTAETVRIPHAVGMSFRDAAGDHLGGYVKGHVGPLDRGTYYLEVGFTSKTYVRFEDVEVRAHYPVESDRDAEGVFWLSDPTRVVVGVRSAHTRPSAVVETAPEPRAMMEAFSYLGSSIKEFSPERSWPRLRGHPPALELGEELQVPPELTRPETGLTLTVPPTYEAVYTTAPLAYYLGATMEPGETTALHTPSGLEYLLETPTESLEDATDRVLVQCFLLDTLTRVGGYYDLDRYEYEKLAPYLPFYPPALYDEPVWKQVEQYLEADFSDVAPHVPRWPVRATLRPAAEDATVIPSLLDDLALVHTANTAAPRNDGPSVVTERYESASRTLCDQTLLDAVAATTTEGDDPRPDVSLVADYDAYATAEVPATDGVLVEDAYERRRDRKHWAVDDAPVTVVCNETGSHGAVERVADRYRTRTDTPSLAVETAHDVTTTELRAILRSEVGFLHYVGPTTETGFRCPDGVLDVRSLAGCGVRSFALSPSASPALGVELAHSGADAGLVAVSDSPSADVVAAAGRIADLLNAGYPFAAVAHAVTADSEYVLVGDGGLELTRREKGEPLYCIDVDSKSADEHEVTVTTFVRSTHKLGAVASMMADPSHDNVHLLGSCVTTSETMATDELLEYFGLHMVVCLNGGPVRRAEGLDARDVVDSVE